MKRQVPPINTSEGAGGLKIHIGELVLEGIPAGAYRRIRDLVEKELAIQLSKQGISQFALSQQHIGRIDAGSFSMQPGAPPKVVGRQIAGSILRALRLAGEKNSDANENPKT